MRALIALLSRELYGVTIALPDFPSMKSVRGLGMSDWPVVADQLAQKFDYINTFYDRPPYFDVTNAGQHREQYDFILSSEVMEHVAPPVDKAFATLASMLKPDGVLVMTTPYSLLDETIEHFSDLHEYAIVKLGERVVLVNRKRDGTVEIHEDLMFHGGVGATLEMRVFSRQSLEEMLKAAGFSGIHFQTEHWGAFGVDMSGPCSLPLAARKGKFRAPVEDITMSYVTLQRVCERRRWRWVRRITRKLGLTG